MLPGLIDPPGAEVQVPDVETDQEYQVWRISGETPTSAGTFAPDADEQQLVALFVDFSGADAIGVSIEPTDGSPAPTGAIVLLGTL